MTDKEMLVVVWAQVKDEDVLFYLLRRMARLEVLEAEQVERMRVAAVVEEKGPERGLGEFVES